MNEEEFEQRLKALSTHDSEKADSGSDSGLRLERALARAKRDTAYKEGLGFISAFLWVLIAGLGLHIYQGVRQRTQKEKPQDD